MVAGELDGRQQTPNEILVAREAMFLIDGKLPQPKVQLDGCWPPGKSSQIYLFDEFSRRLSLLNGFPNETCFVFQLAVNEGPVDQVQLRGKANRCQNSIRVYNYR